MPPRPFISHAQNLEDIVLWRTLGHIPCGRYIDIGASDPRFLSVSRAFYERGWRGIHFEPVPEVAARIRADRPDEVVHEVALSDANQEIDFYVSSIEGTSTGISAVARAVSKPIRVPAKTLASYGSGWAGAEVHWMKIDVEGMEAAVLRGWNPTLLRPWILLIEATLPNSREPSHAEWEPLVLAAGYHFALFDGLNRFYVADEHRELLSALAAPANVFDLMAGCRPESWRPYVIAPSLLSRIQGRCIWLGRKLKDLAFGHKNTSKDDATCQQP